MPLISPASPVASSASTTTSTTRLVLAATAVAPPAVVPVATSTIQSRLENLAVALQTLLAGAGNRVPVLSPGTADAAAFTAAASAAIAKPSLTIADASAAEGNSGTSNMSFVVTLSKPSWGPGVTVNYATSNGTATAGVDYVATSGTIKFKPWQTTATITVPLIGDTVVEPGETFFVTLSNPSWRATITRAVATGRILNDDVNPPVPPSDKAFSPYVSMSNWPVPNLTQLSQASGDRLMNIGFIQADDGGNPSWYGYSLLQTNATNSQATAISQSIADFQHTGGATVLSFGGIGTTLAVYYAAHNISAQLLANTYASVAGAFNTKHLDFDIQDGELSDSKAVILETQAMALLQKSHPDMQVSLTLPVLPTGLLPDALGVVNLALQAGVRPAGISIMAMDFGEVAAPTTGPNAKTMGAYAIQAAQSTYSQMSALYQHYGQTFSWSQLGIVPMIGVNDVTTEVFTVADAQALLKFAAANGVGELSMWSLLRDLPGTPGQVTESTSGLLDPAYSFSKVFNVYGAASSV